MLVIDHGHGIVEFQAAIEDPNKVISDIEDLDLDESVHFLMPPFEDWLEGYHEEDGIFRYNTPKGKKKLVHWGKCKTPESEPAQRVKRLVLDPICVPLDECIRIYSSIVNVTPEPASRNLDIRLYAPGKGLAAHADLNHSMQNEYSFVVYINDDYEGGELIFNDRNLTIKPKAGSVVGFPSLEIHEALPTSSGIKWHIPYFWYLGMGEVMCNKETPNIDWANFVQS